MGRKNKDTIAAEEAVKAAFTAAQAVATAETPEAKADALPAAEKAIIAAETAAETAGKTAEFKEAVDTARALLVSDPGDGSTPLADEAAAEAAAKAEAEQAARQAAGDKKRAEAQAAAKAEAEAVEVAAAAEAADCYRVAPGCALTSKRGIIDAGEKLVREDLHDPEALERFVKSGHIIPPPSK